MNSIPSGHDGSSAISHVERIGSERVYIMGVPMGEESESVHSSLRHGPEPSHGLYCLLASVRPNLMIPTNLRGAQH